MSSQQVLSPFRDMVKIAHGPKSLRLHQVLTQPRSILFTCFACFYTCSRCLTLHRSNLPPSPYAQSFHRTIPLVDARHQCLSSLPPEPCQATPPTSSEPPSSRIVRVGGRLAARRNMGKHTFLTLRSGVATLQVVCSRSKAPPGDNYPPVASASDDSGAASGIDDVCKRFHIGDVLGVEGSLGVTRTGEPSIFATRITLLAPYSVQASSQLTFCPDQKGHHGLADDARRYHYRFMDLICHTKTHEVFRLRHKVFRAVRAFLDDRHFLEVETPVLGEVASGALARPFKTHSHATQSDLYLRVAPELFLKQCIVGGMERVYEIARVFRNEDADRTHNPEFTLMELYMAYTDYSELMNLTEELLCAVTCAATGSWSVPLPNSKGVSPIISFKGPYRRVSVRDALSRALCEEFPAYHALTVASLLDLFTRHALPVPTDTAHHTVPKLFDKLCDVVVIPNLIEPTFLTDLPVFLSPLAKAHPEDQDVAERFELFVNGVELCNAYSELSDPVEQRRRFIAQKSLSRHESKENSCDENVLDERFLLALEVGMPPTVGLGIGMDRLVSLLAGEPSVRECILFPVSRMKTSTARTLPDLQKEIDAP